jgi:hypothetical protein
MDGFYDVQRERTADYDEQALQIEEALEDKNFRKKQ